MEMRGGVALTLLVWRCLELIDFRHDVIATSLPFTHSELLLQEFDYKYGLVSFSRPTNMLSM